MRAGPPPQSTGPWPTNPTTPQCRLVRPTPTNRIAQLPRPGLSWFMFQRVSIPTLIAAASLLGACAADQAPIPGSELAQPAKRAARVGNVAPPPARLRIEPPAPVKEVPSVEQPKSSAPSDIAVVAQILRDARAAYAGSCPCPYDVGQDGKRCAGRSAYSKARGRSPLCYPSQVTPAMVDAYRKRMQ
jgi:hypothetical protein